MNLSRVREEREEEGEKRGGGLNVVEEQSLDLGEISKRAKMRWDWVGGEI